MAGSVESISGPPTIDVPAIGPGEIMIFPMMPSGSSYLLLAALSVALIHGLLTRPGVGRPYLVATRALPPILFIGAAVWVSIHAVWRVPVPNFDGFQPMGDPLPFAAGLLLYGLGDFLLFVGGARTRTWIGFGLGVAGAALVALCGWRACLPDPQPLDAILLVLAIALAAGVLMIGLWRRLGGRFFGWLFVAALIAFVVTSGGMTSSSFIRLPGALLACGLASLAALVLHRTGRDGPRGMGGWGPWLAAVFFQVEVAITVLGAPTF